MTGRLAGRLVGLGITGSIAAYKAAELVRLLRAEGADVQVLMTPSATRFVAPLTLAALSGHAVDADVLELLPDRRIGHIVVADSADAIVVAPATAHWLGAMANGLAADVVTAACLASAAPVVVAPAMDGEMYAPPGHAGQRRPPPRRLRVPDRRAGERSAGLGSDGRRPPRRAAPDRRRGGRGDRRPAGPGPGSGGSPTRARRSATRRRPRRPTGRRDRRRDP